MDAPSAKHQRLKKPKSARTRRILKAHEPKLVETVKQALLIGGHQPSRVGKEALQALQKMKYLEAVAMTRKHVGLAPFEEGGEVLLEKLSQKYDCGLFVVANHTKSKPHNLVFGRFFDHRIYDMVELGINIFQPMESFSSQTAFPLGTKPCFVFMGERFEKDEKMKLLKNVFLDFFRGREAEGISFEGLTRLLAVMAVDGERILLRQFQISPRKQSTGNAVSISLQKRFLVKECLKRLEDFVETGPRFDFVVRRTREAPPELRSVALKKPPTRKREKNVHLDSMQNKVGAVYVPSQEVDRIVTARHKGFKRQRREEREKKRHLPESG